MHMLLVRLLFVFNILVITSCSENYNKNRNCNGALHSVINASNTFALKFLKYLIKTSHEYDDITSLPEYGFFVVCYIATYTYGQAWEDAKDFCGAQTKEQLLCSLEVMLSYSDNPPDGIDFKYGIIGTANYNLTEKFVRELDEIITATAIQLDFQKPIEVLEKVNRLIAKKTNNRVRNAITKPSIFKNNPNAKKLVFANGVFFKGKFQQAFNSSNITKRDYYDMNNNVHKVDYVYQATIYNHSCYEDFDVISVPFVEGFFNFVSINPKKSSDLIAVIEKLQTPGFFSKMVANLKPACIKYSAPFYADVSSENDIGKRIRSTCKFGAIFDPKNSKIRDANGNQVCNFYLGEIRLKTIVNNTLSGIDAPTNECPDSHNLEEYTIVSDHPTIIVIENQKLIRFVTIAAVRKNEKNNDC